MENVLDLRMKLIDKMILEWINSIETSNPEELCIAIEKLREDILKGA